MLSWSRSCANVNDESGLGKLDKVAFYHLLYIVWTSPHPHDAWFWGMLGWLSTIVTLSIQEIRSASYMHKIFN